MKLHYYVLNYNINARIVEQFNIFDSYPLEKATLKSLEKFFSNPERFVYTDVNGHSFKAFDGFCEELRSNIKWQEWGRCQYEIYACGREDGKDLQKFDCYDQCKNNISAIARDIISQYMEMI